MGSITPRNLRFDVAAPSVAQWRRTDPVSAALYDSLSMLFPQGERFFIDSVRHYRHLAHGDLAGDVGGFIAQEAIHTREHAAFNGQLAAAGYEVTRLEARCRRELDATRRRSPLAQLAFTAALEHFTALLAHQLLADPRHLRSAPRETARLWRWHAAEEIEHKAVAFDMLTVATAGWSAPRRWLYRNLLFVEGVAKLLRVSLPNMLDLMRQDGAGVFAPAVLLAHLFGRPGAVRAMIPELARFLLPGFHPWRLEDRALVERLSHRSLTASDRTRPENALRLYRLQRAATGYSAGQRGPLCPSWPVPSSTMRKPPSPRLRTWSGPVRRCARIAAWIASRR